VARFTALGAKPIQSEQNFNVAHLLKKVNEFAGFTALEVLGQELKKVGRAPRSARPSMGMKRAKPEPSEVPCLRRYSRWKTSCFC
jgi:hypothetical protein